MSASTGVFLAVGLGRRRMGTVNRTSRCPGRRNRQCWPSCRRNFSSPGLILCCGIPNEHSRGVMRMIGADPTGASGSGMVKRSNLNGELTGSPVDVSTKSRQ